MTSPYFNKAASYRSPVSTQSTFYTQPQTTPQPFDSKFGSPTLKSAYVSRESKLQNVHQKYDKEAQDVNKKYVQHYQEHLDLGNSMLETQSVLEQERRRNTALEAKLDECFREIDQQKRQKLDLARENTELREEARRKDRLLADVELQSKNVQQNANSVNFENEDFRREMKKLSDTYNIKLKEIEEKYKNQVKDLNEEIEKLRGRMKEQDINVEAKVRTVSRDFEGKVRSLENQIREKDRIISESGFEMRSLKEYNMKVKMEFEEEMRRQLTIIKDSEKVQYEGANKELENQIKQLETEKDSEVKKVESLAQEMKGKDKMLKEMKVRAEDQVGALRREHIQLNDQISVLNSEIERLHSEVAGKELSTGKLHQEIKNLNVELGRQKDQYLPEIDRLMVKNDTDIKRFQDFERKLKARIVELERLLKNSEGESNKLRSDIEKLRENIAGSIHKTIAVTFEGYGAVEANGKGAY